MRKTVLFLLFALYLLFGAIIAVGAADERKGPIREEDYPEKIRVACVGDSITFGSRIANREKNSYPAQLQKLLGPRWTVENFGFSGATMLKVSQKPYWKLDVYPRALEFRPDVVIIALGTNDVHPPTWSLHKGEFAADYKAMIDAFSNLPSKPRIWVCLPVPLFPGRDDKRMTNLKDEAIPIIRQVAQEKGLPIIDLYQALDGKANLFPDKIHPNAAGAEIMARTIYTAITGKSPPE